MATRIVSHPVLRAVSRIELPAQGVKPKQVKHAPAAFLSPEETLAVLRAAKEQSIRDWAMILMAYRHGLRASEVCGL